MGEEVPCATLRFTVFAGGRAGSGAVARIRLLKPHVEGVKRKRWVVEADEYGEVEVDLPLGVYEVRVSMAGCRDVVFAVPLECEGVLELPFITLRRGRGSPIPLESEAFYSHVMTYLVLCKEDEEALAECEAEEEELPCDEEGEMVSGGG